MDVLYDSNRENSRLSYKEFYNDKVNKNEQYRKVNYIIHHRFKSENGFSIVQRKRIISQCTIMHGCLIQNQNHLC